MTLPDLLRVVARNGFVVDARCLGRLAHLLSISVINSVFHVCERFFNEQEIQAAEVTEPPLFILGHWRSGTTHLHNLLSLNEHLVFPTAYQALCPHHFLYTQVAGPVFNIIAPQKRPMDDVAFASYVPHEDEFATAALSTVSPYFRFVFPLSRDEPHSGMDPEHLSSKDLEKWKESFRLFLKKLTVGRPGRLVLKSPPHTGRVRLLLKMFPGAQFIHIVRNPYDVYLSTEQLWRKFLAHSCLQIPAPELVEEIILSSYEELFALFERDRAAIPAGSLHEMRFEDLESDPVKILRSAYQELGLPGFDSFEVNVRRYLGSIHDYQKNAYHLEASTREKVSRRWGATFERYGYAL